MAGRGRAKSGCDFAGVAWAVVAVGGFYSARAGAPSRTPHAFGITRDQTTLQAKPNQPPPSLRSPPFSQ